MQELIVTWLNMLLLVNFSHTPLDHVVQEATVVDLPLGRSVLPGFLKSPHHVTCCWSYKGVEVTTPRDPSLQPGLKTHRDGRSHGWKRERESRDARMKTWKEKNRWDKELKSDQVNCTLGDLTCEENMKKLSLSKPFISITFIMHLIHINNLKQPKPV